MLKILTYIYKCDINKDIYILGGQMNQARNLRRIRANELHKARKRYNPLNFHLHLNMIMMYSNIDINVTNQRNKKAYGQRNEKAYGQGNKKAYVQRNEKGLRAK